MSNRFSFSGAVDGFRIHFKVRLQARKQPRKDWCASSVDLEGGQRVVRCGMFIQMLEQTFIERRRTCRPGWLKPPDLFEYRIGLNEAWTAQIGIGNHTCHTGAKVG